MRPSSYPLSCLRTFCLAALAVAAPAAPELGTGLYRVRDASQVLACGGFTGRCEAMTLGGSLELMVMPSAFGLPTSLRITASDLRLTAQGGTVPFPDPADLQLVGLEGELDAGVLEGENSAGQSAHLELFAVERDFGADHVESILVRGRYDQGCCDRYVFELGNVVLDFVPNDQTLLLDGMRSDRFEVRVRHYTSDGAPRAAVPLRRDPKSGVFWFYSPDNPEIFVKVIDACVPPFEQFWFFAAGLTDRHVMIEVEDRASGLERVYENPAGRAFQSVLDTEAFPCLALP